MSCAGHVVILSSSARRPCAGGAAIRTTRGVMRDNPLIDYEGLPSFSRIEARHAEPAVDHLIEAARREIERILGEGGPWTRNNLALPLEEQSDRLHRAFGPVSHLNAVVQDESLREAFNACVPKLSAWETETGQNEGLYAAWKSLHENRDLQGLTESETRDLENRLRDFRLSGAELDEDDKTRFMEISTRLSQLGSTFSDHLIDATRSWTLHVTDQAELEGLPETALAGAAERARAEGLDGWLLTLDFPCFHAVISHARNRALRERIYHAFTTRASDQGPEAGRFDNSPVMDEILALRHEQARLLGYNNFAEMALETRMADSVDEVLAFLRELARRSKPRAEQELAELRAFAAEQGAEELQAWDLPFWAERLREQRYSISDEALRPWFPVERVIEGLFAVAERLFGTRFEQDTMVETWHPDVRYYRVLDDSGEEMAGLFFDLYARDGKRGGAWMDECLVRRRRAGGGVQKPVAYLTCNFTPPAGGRPGLLTHSEVETLFHEFGHGLHHMLTEEEVPGISGINGVAWDAVEMPSQLLENWCWTEEGLALISGHYETGEPLPRETLERMLAARNFQSAMQMMRQLEFSLFDMRLHAEYEPGLSPQRLLDEVRAEVSVMPPPAFNRFQHSFAHIFAGGYAAGYYSYKWAEVLAADAWSRFREEGVFGSAGRDFRRCILARGGSRDAAELFRDFRGREPSIEPLLQQSGITGG